MKFHSLRLIISVALVILGCTENQFAGNLSTQDKEDTSDDKTGATDSGEVGDPLFTAQEGEEEDEAESDGSDGEDEEEEELAKDDFQDTENFAELDMDEYSKSCLSDQDAVDDANATFTFGEGSADVREFVNERCNTAVPNIGAIHSGQETADFVCLLKGYRSAEVTFKREYDSPKNNYIAHWDGSAKEFITTGAKDWNTKIHGMTCRGKLSERCSLDNAKIDCR